MQLKEDLPSEHLARTVICVYGCTCTHLYGSQSCTASISPRKSLMWVPIAIVGLRV